MVINDQFVSDQFYIILIAAATIIILSAGLVIFSILNKKK